jgi:hypothetical protein
MNNIKNIQFMKWNNLSDLSQVKPCPRWLHFILILFVYNII